MGDPDEPDPRDVEQREDVEDEEFSEANELVAEIRGRRPKAAEAERYGLAEGPPGRAERAELVVFTGFLGDPVSVPGRDGEWTLLYTDLGLNEWVIVEPGECVRRKRVRDGTMLDIERDLIWVRSQAFVGRGSGPPSVESQFLTGDFMRAGDFEDGLDGGTFGPPTGVFCGAKTLRCCHRKSS